MDKPKVVARQEDKPCGCRVIEFSDKTGNVIPCPPCGMMEVARGLNIASNAMAAVANRLRAQANQAIVADAARVIAGGG